MDTIALFFLASVAVGGIAWVFLYPILSGERKAEQRMASVAESEPARRAQCAGRKSPVASQSKIHSRSSRNVSKKNKRAPLTMRIAQAGLTWSKRQFLLGVRPASASRWPWSVC